MNLVSILIACCLLTTPLLSQDPAGWISSLPQAKDYVQHRVSSYDRSGANADARPVAPGETLTLLDEAGPGLITHVWVTIASDDPNHLKALVLRMYWDGESHAQCRGAHWRFLRARAGRLSPLSVARVVGKFRQGAELFSAHAFSEACAHHGDERRFDQDRRVSTSTSTTALTARRCPRISFTSTRSTARKLRRKDGAISGSRTAMRWSTTKRI